MNRTERDDLLLAAAESFPDLRYAGLSEVLSALDESSPAGRWRLLLGADSAWTRPGLELVPEDPKGKRLSVEWDAAVGAVVPAEPRRTVRSSWAATRFADAALAERWRTFARLCPVSHSWRDAAGAEWALVLAKPEPWPRFLRLDVSLPFGPRATEHSALLLSRGVEEVGYRGTEARVAVG